MSSVIPVIGFVALVVLGIVWRKTKGRRGEKKVAALLAFSRKINIRLSIISYYSLAVIVPR